MYEEMQAFAAVVEQSSLNQASKLLNLSQPALSRKIAKLEDELGVTLFNRVGKRLELTSIGRLAYDFAIEQQQQQLKFLQALAQFKDDTDSAITLGASLTTLQTTLPPLITAFMDNHPHAEIKLVTGKTHEIVSSVRDKQADVGIVASSINEPGLNCLPLFDDHLELVVASTHPLSGQASKMDDLQKMPMITFSKGTWYRKLTDDLFHRSGVMPDIRMEIDSFEAIVRLLPTCKLAALLPKSYLRPQLLADNDLITVHIPELRQTRRTTCMIYGQKEELSATAKQWIHEIREYFAARRG
ncbi:LysR family transcriptional regulator [Paenibacillus sp. 453mf]|uniref:LysR family transcriptional regulator n=1 Tax=Paenibacillus sp. 453mf TaxID=1761874 RepID=UPI0008EB2F00|nr:LysR family transcriptional regulator [Paenibacillus sp. 453mf]SFS91668.1 DNA-binding transcriptional regulator, LysR family [Paenibacillus sp. 453mf]